MNRLEQPLSAQSEASLSQLVCRASCATRIAIKRESKAHQEYYRELRRTARGAKQQAYVCTSWGLLPYNCLTYTYGRHRFSLKRIFRAARHKKIPRIEHLGTRTGEALSLGSTNRASR